jgi:hypothetical protein
MTNEQRTSETMDVGTILDFVKERDAALSKLDMEWARRMMPHASSDEVRLIAMHKARHQAINIPERLRRQSARWLFDHHYKDLLGNPIDPLGPLPS